VSQSINFCHESKEAKLWHFTLPEIVEGGNGTVSIKAIFNTTLFTFSEFDKELSQ
jgi:hypothetical protein